ncbi:MAG: glycine/sarcosine/betaine reductase complex component C subunit beta [Candidatus Cloacimonetes bacterium]|nr:glycine/sarcosine/betaine reductase complex component C subunit beta [Candidatus Cloacimonadota bacterium]
MTQPVLKSTAYVLVHAPDMVQNGSTQTTEKIVNPDSEYLKKIDEYLRPFEKVVSYPPNQTYIGKITPAELKTIEFPWYDKEVKDAHRFGPMGEIMPQEEFIALLKIVDSFDLVLLEKGFVAEITPKIAQHPALKGLENKIGNGVELSEIQSIIDTQHPEPIYHNKQLVGCVKRAHDIDVNLNSHVIFENLVSKASGVLALNNLALKNNIDLSTVDYVIECSEEACGDMNQRGGGNFAKSIAEISGAVNATGSDTRGFCAAPAHALILAASLVKAGTFKNVAVLAGGATAKLGMNGKDHIKKGLPILEDVIGGFAALISENDFNSPIFNTDLVGKHDVGTGSSPQAVMTALVANPLAKGGLKITDIDKFSVEMQNPDITKPAGAGDVPEANYKMIAALAVMKQQIERNDIPNFIEKHGMSGWAPTQGHIPSGAPYLGFAIKDLTDGELNRVMIVGKGSLFLGRMTNLFDGVSIVLERNNSSNSIPAVENQCEKNIPAKIKVAVTTLGSEHGVENIIKGAEIASKMGNFDVVLIGPKISTLTLKDIEWIDVPDEKLMYSKMEELLDNGYIKGCVTMHYNFPIGVSTVGKIITPALGKELFLATTTGTSDTDRVNAMVKNTINGIITAKAMGIEEPTVGILNLDGARAVERALNELSKKGYKINLALSNRADGGSVMRGNDLLNPNFDVMVTDTLTGNILMKLFSAYATGGNYEATGYGYGPGIGEGCKRLVLILSRASGSPVIANALLYAATLAKGDVLKINQEEYQKANNAGLQSILTSLAPEKTISTSHDIKTPDKEIVTEEITGIEIFDLENAVILLKSKGVYAESGMGCTGPVVLVNEKKHSDAKMILIEGGYIAKD